MNIVSFARAIPYREIPHAGGAYLRSHLGVLADTNRVTLVVPGTKRNTGDSKKLDIPVELTVIPGPRSLPGRLRARLISELCPVVAPPYMVSALKNNPDLQQVIAAADIIEFQWSEYASLSRIVKRLNPDAILICISHDVLKQKYRRRLDAATSFKSYVRSLFGLFSSMLFEERNIGRMDRVLVFSAKDRELLGNRLLDRTVVVNPPIATTAVAAPKTRYEVLFTGALSRPENNEGICWFIENCWDSVVKAVPAATLVVAGANPLPQVLQLSAGRADIKLTGFLKDLDIVYPTASVFVNPVLSGAGVKFKTITAMLYGVPVVSTTVGAEGVGTDGLYIRVTDDPAQFSNAVVTALTDYLFASELANSTKRWAEDEYGIDRFKNALESIYTSKRDADSHAYRL